MSRTDQTGTQHLSLDLMINKQRIHRTIQLRETEKHRAEH